VKLTFDKSLQIIALSALSLLVLNSCSSAKFTKEETLASLEKKDIKSEKERAQRKRTTPLASRNEARFNYRKFAEQTRNEALRIQALERLADLDSEQNTTQQNFQEIQNKESKLDKLDALANQNTPPQDKSSDYKALADQYEGLLQKQSNQKKEESILYQLAHTYENAGDPEKQLDALNRLAKRYPHSRRREEVHFRRGELYFLLKQYSKAIAAYAEVMKDDDSAYYERALHKHGWSQFKSNNYDGALDSFYKLLDLNFKGGRTYEELSKTQRSIVDDTLGIASLIFSYEKGPESIKDYSRKVGRRVYEHNIYDRLGKLYLEQERYEDAASTYAAFVDLYEFSEYSPRYMMQMINIYEKWGITKPLLQAKSQFVTKYGVRNIYWSRVDRALLEEMKPILKKNLKELATHFHAIGQKTKKKEDYQIAAKWYKEFVDSFPNEPETPEMNFLLAENLNESGDIEAAAKEYETTAYEYQDHPKKAEAGYAALLALEELVKKAGPEDMDIRKKMALDNAVRFADTFPNDKRASTVLLRAAEDYAKQKDMMNAAIIAQRVVDVPSQSKEIKAAAFSIIAAAEFSLGNNKKAELATIRRLREGNLSDKEREANIERLAASVYKQGEEQRNQGNYEAAAEQFLRIRSLAPKSKIRITAEFDAAAALLKVEKYDQAIPILSKFVEDFPQSKYIDDVLKQLAFSYEKLEDWSNAAFMYKQIAERESNPEIKRGLIWQTANLYEKANAMNEAMDVYKDYIEKYPEPKDQAMDARIKLADNYKQQNNVKNRNFWLSQIIKQNKVGAATERSNFLAANAALELAQPSYQEYHDVHLVQPLKKNLKKKKQLLKTTVDAFTEVANYGVAEVATAATYRIAEIYGEFSKGLLASERPPGLNGSALEEYELLLEEQAFPFEEKAIQIHETNAGRITDGIYDKWVKESIKALGKLKPVRYAKMERSEKLSEELGKI